MREAHSEREDFAKSARCIGGIKKKIIHQIFWGGEAGTFGGGGGGGKPPPSPLDRTLLCFVPPPPPPPPPCFCICMCRITWTGILQPYLNTGKLQGIMNIHKTKMIFKVQNFSSRRNNFETAVVNLAPTRKIYNHGIVLSKNYLCCEHPLGK